MRNGRQHGYRLEILEKPEAESHRVIEKTRHTERGDGLSWMVGILPGYLLTSLTVSVISSSPRRTTTGTSSPGLWRLRAVM